jgi:hypothetical protein
LAQAAALAHARAAGLIREGEEEEEEEEEEALEVAAGGADLEESLDSDGAPRGRGRVRCSGAGAQCGLGIKPPAAGLAGLARSLRRSLQVAQPDAALAVGAVQVKAARGTRTRSKPAKKKAKEEAAPLPPEEPLYEPRLPE